MKTVVTRWVVLVAALIGWAVSSSSAHADTVVLLTTNVSTQGAKSAINYVLLQLFDKQAPVTVANFLKYVSNDIYDGTFLHRNGGTWTSQTTFYPFVLQGGGFKPHIEGNSITGADPVTNYGTITNEFSSSRSNVYGTIAMAKLGGDPNSASNQWFINMNNNSANLDTQNGGFTVFGQVIGEGMALMEKIQYLPTKDLSSYPYYWGSAFDTVPVLTGPTLVMINSASVRSEFTAVDWKGGGDGDWGVASHWGSLGPTDGPGTKVGFGSINTAANNVADMKTSGKTVGMITFSPGTSTTIKSSGGYSLTLSNSDPILGSMINVAGTHTISAPVVMNNDVTVSGSGTLNMTGGISGNHALRLTYGTLNVSSIVADSLVIGSSNSSGSASAASVPEPSTAILLGLGAVGLCIGLLRRRLKRG